MLSKVEKPQSKAIDVVDSIHGINIVDPYRWLEEESRKTNNWIRKQNLYARSFLDKISVRKNLKQRLEELYHIDSFGIPVPRKDRYFFMDLKGSQDLAVLYVQDGLKGKPRILIDQNKLSKDKTTVIKGWSASWDGKLLAYSLSEASNDQASVYVMDVDTGKKLTDVIPGDLYPSWGVWKPDNSGFWYTHRHPEAPKGEEKFHQKLYFHNLGSDFKEDPLIFGEHLAKEDTPGAQISKDGRYLLISVYFSSTKKEKTEIYIKDLNDIKSDFIPVVKGIDASLFYGTILKDSIYIITNHKAPKWKIMYLDIKDVNKGIKAWRTVIPESKNYTIDMFALIQDCLFVEFLENVHSILKIFDLKGKFIKEISLPTLGSIDGLTGEEDGSELFFSLSSYLLPTVIYRYDLKSSKASEFKRVKLGFNEKKFIVKQAWFSSKGGTKIPMFLVHKKSIKLDNNNPTLLYGYGGFNISITPGFNRTIIPFLENGGVYVDAILRGGGEFGEEWHKAGMKSKKQNVFDDFIAAAQWLTKNKYTNPNKLALLGWSNGGLLVGAATVQRPELFKIAVIGAPVLDMIRYHLFHGGRHWIQEYGSAENRNEIKYLLKYSPYHNVREGKKYPATLILTADKDDRVHPMHAFKMAARLQQVDSSDNPILIRIETKAGHGGAAPIYRFVEQYADVWSFIYWQLGMIETKLEKIRIF